jgi:hypothetical protein
VKNIFVSLPDAVYELAKNQANALKIDVQSYCASILSDYLLAMRSSVSNTPELKSSLTVIGNQPSTGGSFRVIDHFPGFPQNSVLLAQEFVNATLRFPNVEALLSGEESDSNQILCLSNT